MENKAEYLERLQQSVEKLHRCSARHIESVRVTEIFRGDKTWQGTVEVFEIAGHPQAARAYCWSRLRGGHDARPDFVAMLAIPPIESPLSAVRAWIQGDSAIGPG